MLSCCQGACASASQAAKLDQGIHHSARARPIYMSALCAGLGPPQPPLQMDYFTIFRDLVLIALFGGALAWFCRLSERQRFAWLYSWCARPAEAAALSLLCVGRCSWLGRSRRPRWVRPLLRRTQPAAMGAARQAC